MQQFTFLGVPALSYGDDIPQGSHSGELLHLPKHLYGLCYHFRGNLSSLYIAEKLISNLFKLLIFQRQILFTEIATATTLPVDQVILAFLIKKWSNYQPF